MPYVTADSLKGLFRLARRNVVRQRRRTAVTLSAIVFGVAALILAGGFVADVFVQLGEALIHSKSGHIQVGRQGFFSYGSRSPEKFLLEDPDADKVFIRGLPQVEAVMARIQFSGLLNNGRTDLPVIGEGVEPDLEPSVSTYMAIAAGRQLTEKDVFGAMIGEGVARALNLAPGNRVTLVVNTLDGAMNTIDLEVVGVFQTFSKEFDARAIRIRLAAAQELLYTSGVNTLVISLKRTEDTDTVVDMLRKAYRKQNYDVKSWVQLNDFYEKTVELYRRQFGVLQLVVLLLVMLSVVNIINMSVFERAGEFGTMRALGNRDRDVFVLLMAESVVLGAVGSTVGVLLGVGLALLISKIGIPMPPPPNADLGYTAYIRLDALSIALAFVVGVLATVFASVFPALRMARIAVVEQLRRAV
ncbi:MAG: ABC transporter permease [Burkholderiales bacterium]|nr:ABC transporter permease [Burkholderiales bacterium]